jgi:3-oxoacyl-[acyl-carrier protein] reductase
VNPHGATALVTGAASGIGRAAAQLLAARGASVVVADIDEAGMLDTVARIAQDGGRASARVLDVGRAESIADAFGDLSASPPEIVFNCAGIVSGQPDFPLTPPARTAHLLAVNVLGTILVTRAAIVAMGARAGGAIVNVSSTAAVLLNHPDPVYGASKAAVKTFTEQCAPLALTRGVRVNAVLPGAVDTPIIAKTGDGRRPAEWLVPRLDEVRLIAPIEVAAVMVELVEDDSRCGEAVVMANAPAAST